MSGRRRAAVAGAVAVLLVGAAWMWRPALPPVQLVSRSPPAAPAASATGAAALSLDPDSGPARASGTRPAHAQDAASTPALQAIEVCGVGSVRRTGADAPRAGSLEALPPALGVYARREAWPRVLAHLDAWPSDRERATALALRASGLLDAEAQQSPGTVPPEEVTDMAARQLAGMAAGTRDMAVLRMALAECRLHPRVTECGALSPQPLVRAEPEDGAHWLELASVASRAGDRQAALQRAVQARRFSGMPSLVAAVDAAVPPDLPPYLRLELLVQALGIGLRWVDWAAMAPIALCRDGTLAPAQCVALAEAMLAGAETLDGLSAAEAIGRRGGWPVARSQAVLAERDALMARLHRGPQPLEAVYTCDAVAWQRALLLAIARQGQRAALKERASR